MEIVCLDTDILIDHKRAREKDKTKFFQLSAQYHFAVSVITVYELLRGDNSEEDKFWKGFFSQVTILDMTMESSEIAGGIYRNLKQTGNLIGVEDILISSIALKNNMKLATSNVEHFGRITGLELV